MKARIQDATVKPVLSGPRIERTSSIKRTTVKSNSTDSSLSFMYLSSFMEIRYFRVLDPSNPPFEAF